MPSPRTVLHDIIVHGLDPKRAYANTSASGHLKSGKVAETDVVEITKSVKIVEKKLEKKKPEPKPGLVKLHCENCSKMSDCKCECEKCLSKPQAKKDFDIS